ncbi:MAG: ATP-binding cassette domain-containing protein [bacterium]|nr:ATP-binding cassette domain-containing protein [bacterium]
MLCLTGAQLRLGGSIIFSELNWRIDSSSRVGLVGPNGSGKSSLLRVLVGEYSLEQGSLDRAKNFRVGYLPQDSAELPQKKVGEALWEAFEPLNDMEREMKSLLHVIEDSAAAQAERDRAVRRYGELQDAFVHRGGYQRETEARKILLGLGFQHEDWDRPVAEFSGGWRMRVLLGRLLLEKPDMFLLDEPTNHLDPDTLEWLEQYLKGLDSGLVIVSHDRFFLDRLANGIAEIDRGRFRTYSGNYSKYRQQKELMREQLIAQKKQQDKQIAHLESFVERFRAKASKATQAQSRIKQLEKIERIELEDDAPIVSIPMPPTPRGGKEAIVLDGVEHRYGELQALHPVSATVYRGDRICVWGANGAGKSTLLSILSKSLEPSGGSVSWGHNAHVAYFSQQHAELQSSSRTIIDELAAVAPPEMQMRLRDVLAPFLFRGDDVFKPVSVLSGGEKSRVALAKLLVKPCNILILDEPLNHLDMNTVETLERTLQEFSGAIVFVSHDRFFADRLAQQIWEMKAGRLTVYKGNFNDYQYAKSLIAEKDEAVTSPVKPVVDDSSAALSREARKEQKRREAEERNKRSAALKGKRERQQAIEVEMEEIDDEVAGLEQRMASGELVRKPDEMRDARRRYDELLEKKDVLFEEWSELVEAIDSV